MCMGKTHYSQIKTHPSQDNPHVHGEDSENNEIISWIRRIIPMCMGKTFSADLLIDCGQDNPHVHGEDVKHFP